MSSARPTTFATASTCTGCTANSRPASSAATSFVQRRASAATATATPACHSRFTAWNQTALSNTRSKAYVAMTSGRYKRAPSSGGQYGAANARQIPDGCATNGFVRMMGRSSSANWFHRAPK